MLAAAAPSRTCTRARKAWKRASSTQPRLDLPDGSVDGVLSRFGYLLKGEPPPALAESRRVLRQGGRLAFAVWAARERCSWMTVPADALRERGHLPDPSQAEARLSARRNPAAIRALLEEAGFALEEIAELDVRYRFADAEELWRFVRDLRGPLSLALDPLDAGEQRLVRDLIERRAEPSGDGSFALLGVALVGLARVNAA